MKVDRKCKNCRYFGREYGFFPAGWFCDLHLITVYPDESCEDFKPRKEAEER